MNYTRHWKKERAVSVAMVLLLIFIPMLLAQPPQEVRVVYPHEEGAPPQTGPESIAGNTLTLQDEFVSHLPLVVVNTAGEALPMPSVYSSQLGYRQSTRVNPYIDAGFYLVDNPNRQNRLGDAPALESAVQIKLRGNSSLDYAKKQYAVRFVQQDGDRNPVEILGMGADWEWVLNISYIDKSLLRNYLTLNIARNFFDYSVEMRYCEVFFQNGGSYEYAGLYLLMESVKQGAERVNIPKYDKHFAETSYMLCRDRYEEGEVFVESYGFVNKLTQGNLEIEYPEEKDITPATLEYITQDISKIEKTLYSADPKEFMKYRKLIDTQSFLDYFILNEFFMNYDAKFNSSYMYRSYGEALHMGPLWDFDQAIDNSLPHKAKLDSTAMHDATWYTQLLRDGEFVRLLCERYHELREGVLSSEYLSDFIDKTVLFLGNAHKRDWARWQYNDPAVLQRDNVAGKVPPTLLDNTRNFEQEIVYIKTQLLHHAAWLDDNIESLYQFSVFPPEK